jgi:hypothetical protein
MWGSFAFPLGAIAQNKDPLSRLAKALFWPLGDITKESAANGLIAQPTFRLSLAIATLALAVFAATALLRVSGWEFIPARKLNLASMLSAGAAILSVLVGIVATRA